MLEHLEVVLLAGLPSIFGLAMWVIAARLVIKDDDE